MIKTHDTKERVIEWVVGGAELVTACIRNGTLTDLDPFNYYRVDNDAGGFVDFAEAIKKAKEETR